MAPSLTLDSYRQIGRNAAGYALGLPVAPVPTVLDNFARAKLIVRTTLLHARESAEVVRDAQAVTLDVTPTPVRDALVGVAALGVIFTADRPPEELPAFAAAAEAAGLDELWLWEDCFFAGGIAASATALAATERHHGRDRDHAGGLPQPGRRRDGDRDARHGSIPGRFVAGLGHGVPAWMDQIGALPREAGAGARGDGDRASGACSPASASASTATTSTCATSAWCSRRRSAPPVVLGVRRPLGLRASGRSADGTILAEPSPPAYIRWARERIEEGRAAAGRTDPHRVTVFVKCRVDADRRHARERGRGDAARARASRRSSRRSAATRSSPRCARSAIPSRDPRRPGRPADRHRHGGAGHRRAARDRGGRRRRDRVRADRPRSRGTAPLARRMC